MANIYNSSGNIIPISGGGEVNPWLGKIASFLGDSITQGEGTTKRYHQFLKEYCDFIRVNNYGVNGMKLSGANGMTAKIEDVSSSTDILFVLGGVNDFAYGNVPMGEFYTTDASGTRTLTEDVTTFKGSLVKLCNYASEHFADKTVVLMTPVHMGWYQWNTGINDLKKNTQNLYLEDYVAAIKEAAKIYSFHCIDLYSESGLNPQNEENVELYFHPNDRLHPNAVGHERMAKTIYGKLKTIFPMDS